MHHSTLRLLLAGALFAGSLGARAENWAQWRGPAFNGSSPETGLPLEWSRSNHVAWAADLPGMSGATPAIWGDSVFVSSPDAENNLLLLCLDRRDGKVRWQRKLGAGNFTHGNNNLASPSPATDGQVVVALFGSGHDSVAAVEVSPVQGLSAIAA